MKSKLFGAVLVLAFLSASATLAADAQLMVPIHQFIDDFNKGDVKGAAAAHLSGASIIDEVPPHHWAGPGSVQAWAKSLMAASKAAGQTDEKVTLGEPTRADINGSHGYVVIPATFSYKEKGSAMKEPAQMTYALTRMKSGWKIAGWTWVGTTPQPDK
ncbi:nuclear transport factor 2 family protein [Phenylobacterium montanum]|uniref:Nuclear transport factor 2 family protein n=1 Tax=Phenylobacterium montanum TaxID=2823693 RepID=A0A975FVG6_9CAUL|nr:nuclear transport factor 2 family protein [Caulobacter sp. S6]QUD86218.1 nuclear transport factor 2 family protein [Caulobacter sp. S6]